MNTQSTTMQSATRHLLGTASVLVLSTAALVAAAQPANAQATKGIYAGGSTLASEAFRQIFDCYTGATIGNDGLSFSSSFSPATPTPGLLPTTCTIASTVQGMVAGVGSGNGVRGFIANNAAQWSSGTVTPNTMTNISINTPFPAGQPPFVDSVNSTNFGSYPYPRIDITLSEAPLPPMLAGLTTVSFSFSPSTGWASGGVTTSTTQITLNSTTAAPAYSTTVYGQPIQIPAFEINVAIAVNVNSTAFQINSQIRDVHGNIVPGGAIQLTEGQMCAIFSGLVTDWSDGGPLTLPTIIPYLNSTGTQQTAAFDYANVGNGIGNPQPYASSSLPIRVVYQSDGSGETFILTNYLKAVCPLLDPTGTFKYGAIFGASNLPSTSFKDLIKNINLARPPATDNFGNRSPAVTDAWVGVVGSGGVAAAVNNDTGHAGNIGYVGANFTQPYAIASTAPVAASLQDEDLRINGTDVPNATATTLTFIAPTPAAADEAWNDTRLQAPATTWTWNDYNIYGNTFTTPVTQGSVWLSGQSVLPLTDVQGAYPLAGTTFLELYSCYNRTSNASRVVDLTGFLSWYVNGADSTSPSFDAKVSAVVQNNGFHLVPVQYAQNIVSQYLTFSSSHHITASDSRSPPRQTAACVGVTGGAADGAL
jgi:phosphate transport system substrate-binding protein